MPDFGNFLYKYAMFLFFIVFIIGLGGGEYFGGNIEGLEAPVMAPPDPDATWLTGFLGTASYFVSNIAFFFTLMTVDTGVGWIGILIFSPSIIYLMYGLLKLIRGGG